jgi:hypothetical protein
MPKRTSEPQTQIGIPMRQRTGSALQRDGDADNENDTAHDQPAPPVEPAPAVPDPGAAEVILPEDAFEPGEAPAAAPAVSSRKKAATSVRTGAKTSTRSTAVSGRASAASDRSAAKKSSRRATAVSGGAPAASSRRTPIDRSALQKALLWTGVGILGVAVVVTAIIVLATRGSEDRRVGGEAIAEARRQGDLVSSALANRKGAEARRAFDAALKALTATPQLGGAIAIPPEQPPVVRELAIRAYGMRTEVEALAERITAVEAENAADANLASLKTRLATLNDPANDLEALEKDVLAFIANPVDPKSGPSTTHAEAFSRLAGEAKLRLAAIAAERERRQEARSTGPVRLAAGEIDGLIQQERFGAAQERLAELAKEYPEADFARLRTQVEESAEKAWRSAKSYADTKLADWRSPGATESQRAQALKLAKERLEQVVSRFGIDSYVGQARGMLSPLP